MATTIVDDFVFKTKPWAHQRAALEFLNGHRAALLDYEMGTGKTRVLVDWISNQPPGACHLVLCPKKVIPVWESEFAKWSSSRYWVAALEKSSESAKKKATKVSQLIAWKTPKEGHKVIVVNYESAWRPGLKEVLLGHRWDTVVLDESHRIKDPTGRASKFCSQLGRRSARNICLTGTPLPHSPLDSFAQFRFLDPEVFGHSWTKFRARYAVMGGYAVNGRPVQVVGYRNEGELAEKMGSLTIQARTDDVLDLPDAHHIDREVELGQAGMRAYREMERLFMAYVNGRTVTATNTLVKLLRLQQITSGYLPGETPGAKPQKIDDSKEGMLREILEDLQETEKVVVFCRFTADIEAVKRVAADLGRRSAELSGQVNDLATWKADPGITILAAQVQAGKEGISLVEARYAIYYSIGYSLGDFIQSLARIRRPGQGHRCTYYHLIAKGTIDRKVYKALQKRKVVVDAILDDIREGKV